MKTWKLLFSRPGRLVICGFGFLSCGEKEGGEGNTAAEKQSAETRVPWPEKQSNAKESPESGKQTGGHEEMLVRLFEFKRDFLRAMGGITDGASAREFVGSLEGRKAGLSELLKEAQALLPAGPAIRRRYQKMQGKLAKQSDLVRRHMEERLENHPEAAKIGETLGVLVEDQAAEDLNGAFEELYRGQNLESE